MAILSEERGVQPTTTSKEKMKKLLTDKKQMLVDENWVLEVIKDLIGIRRMKQSLGEGGAEVEMIEETLDCSMISDICNYIKMITSLLLIVL